MMAGSYTQMRAGQTPVLWTNPHGDQGAGCTDEMKKYSVSGVREPPRRAEEERLYVPVRATYSIEHEREDGSQEIEFQIKWDTAED